MGDKSLEKFRVEYEKLHRALKKSHDGEKRLMQKCRELNAEIVANAAKVTTALKLSQDDKSTISTLKQVLDNAQQTSIHNIHTHILYNYVQYMCVCCVVKKVPILCVCVCV